MLPSLRTRFVSWLSTSSLALVALSGCMEEPPDGPGDVESESPIEAEPEQAEAHRTEATVDLLRTVECTVAVSSKVNNRKDFPEHLVDGALDTAWNGRTGELDGWIAFRTPKEARVQRVELTTGVDAGASFEKNHRVTRIRISREGVPLAEASLDPDERGLQGVDVDARGGDFLVEILETKPGTEKRWREVVVSELRVLGTTGGAPSSPGRVPALAIGSLDGVPALAATPEGMPARPWKSVEALCAAWSATFGPRIRAAYADRYPGPIDPPYCSVADVPAGAPASVVAAGPFLEARWLHLMETHTSSVRIAVRTAQGWSLTPIELGEHSYDDPGCGHASAHVLEDARVIRTSLGREVVVVRALLADGYWGRFDAPNPSGVVEEAYACDADSAGMAVCQGPLEVGRAWGMPDGWSPGVVSIQVPDVAAIRWSKRSTPTLGPAGDLR